MEEAKVGAAHAELRGHVATPARENRDVFLELHAIFLFNIEDG